MRRVQSHGLRWAALLVTAVMISACNAERGDITASIPDNAQARHPILVTRGMATLDLLPGGGPGGLTNRQVTDIGAFAAGWTANGRGGFTIEVPSGAGPITDKQSAHVVKEIRAIALGAGVPLRAMTETRYPADGPGHLAPVRLSYSVLEARLPHECDQARDDAGFSNPKTSNENRQNWNFGCAYQQNLAAMVADPEDLIRPRAEDPPSANRRANVISKYRTGVAAPAAQTSVVLSTSDE
ncbi:CpaD family pilus assembly protein [Terrihabitans rhizophilus]|uniref:CpaD family pilus assembly protein n=1 Tax=Terrihabitans rhizophilus TaxID=3092662 RepID=A0ABU4RJZ9_9HYPH|nr:CpaD family pilus assembly protein [Terrihabitans sp. PJ23]MDX6804508.1 CpaD family pilus assembly protein [Terrihabitans sp. PJ23]